MKVTLNAVTHPIFQNKKLLVDGNFIKLTNNYECEYPPKNLYLKISSGNKLYDGVTNEYMSTIGDDDPFDIIRVSWNNIPDWKIHLKYIKSVITKKEAKTGNYLY